MEKKTACRIEKQSRISKKPNQRIEKAELCRASHGLALRLAGGVLAAVVTIDGEGGARLEAHDDVRV